MLTIKSRIRETLLPLILLVLLYSCSTGPSGTGMDYKRLADSFMHPPNSARPGVYWYFMDGNLSRKEMTADLESMKKVGIGHVLFLEVNVGVPQGPVKFLSPAWQESFKHAVKECERLGIVLTLGSGPGWTGSGGPWVKMEESMQHLVASKIEVVNLWRNRMVGDLDLSESKRYTTTTVDDLVEGEELAASGLMGPVSIELIK